MSFTLEKAKVKLQTLTNTQQSIQSTSQWCLFHTRHASDIVSIWQSLFSSAKSNAEYRLVLFYLCNDILQLARKNVDKHASFFTNFKACLPRALSVLQASKGDNLSKYKRVLDVWSERHVYDAKTIAAFGNHLNSKAKAPADNSSPVSTVATSSNDIPDALKSVINKYSELTNLTKDFKTNYSKFHTSSTIVLKSDLASDIPQLQSLGEEIQEQSQKLVSLRNDIATEMRNLAGELDDWQLLDQKKVQNVKTTCEELKRKLANHEAEKQQQLILENEDDDQMPMYDNEDGNNDNSSEEVSPAFESDSDNAENEDSESDRKRQKLDFQTETSVQQSESWNSLNAILKQLS